MAYYTAYRLNWDRWAKFKPEMQDKKIRNENF